MTKKIFRSILLATMSVFVVSLVLSLGALYRYFSQVQLDQLKTEATLVAHGITEEGKAYFDDLKLANVRITWVDNRGDVLYDTKSEASQMENHLHREEIKEALSTGYGKSMRYSQTLTQKYVYYAKRLGNGTIVRLSVSQDSIFRLLMGMLPYIVVIIVIALSLSIWMARSIAKKLIFPLNHLNLDHPLDNDLAYEELTPLLRKIDHNQKEIAQNESLLDRKISEFDTIIAKIKEGMILLDNQRQIVSINPAAKALFGLEGDCVGKNMLDISRDSKLTALLDTGFQNHKAERLLHFQDKTYQTLVRPVTSDGELTGVVLLLFDASEEFKNEQMRREFTANISHELKTPLQSILGYSEIMKNNLASPSDIQTFSEKIYAESQRTVQLVEDIIYLSQLDESAYTASDKVDLYQVTENVVDSLSFKADQQQIELILTGSSASLYGDASLLHSLVYNLCDNAIKYNQAGGQVFVEVMPDSDKVILQVRDTGIGISKENQERIFERFYRVDKSRSKQVGGTGLGLSIVKHIAKLHHASIFIDSQEGQGTSITLYFPLDKE